MDVNPCLLSVVIPTFRDGERASNAVTALLRQSLPDGMEREIIVVDDGSDDDTAGHLSKCIGAQVRILRLPFNQGRSAARNAGAAIAAGEFVVFMDCDCAPKAGFLTAHLTALNSGAAASTGHVAGEGEGFWNRYQSEASTRRQHQHEMGMPYVGSSQNLAVRRSAFTAVGGFDTSYRRYGFEDRDLLVRVAKLGRVAWASQAIVHHQDRITLSQVSAKMTEAGEHSSTQFAQQHPDAYVRLGYAAIDTRIHPIMKIFAPTYIPIASLLATGFDYLRGERWLPYFLARRLVKIVAALSYSGGTARGR